PAPNLGYLSEFITAVLQSLPPDAFVGHQTGKADLAFLRGALLADPQNPEAGFLGTVLHTDNFRRLQAGDAFQPCSVATDLNCVRRLREGFASAIHTPHS